MGTAKNVQQTVVCGRRADRYGEEGRLCMAVKDFHPAAPSITHIRDTEAARPACEKERIAACEARLFHGPPGSRVLEHGGFFLAFSCSFDQPCRMGCPEDQVPCRTRH
jgi:hypothetical protein